MTYGSQSFSEVLNSSMLSVTSNMNTNLLKFRYIKLMADHFVRQHTITQGKWKVNTKLLTATQHTAGAEKLPISSAAFRNFHTTSLASIRSRINICSRYSAASSAPRIRVTRRGETTLPRISPDVPASLSRLGQSVL